MFNQIRFAVEGCAVDVVVDGIFLNVFALVFRILIVVVLAAMGKGFVVVVFGFVL